MAERQDGFELWIAGTMAYREATEPRPIEKAQPHAPRGGIEIDGFFYEGGEFIPDHGIYMVKVRTGGGSVAPPPALPPPRPLPANMLMPDKLSHEEYVEAFMDEFGTTPSEPIHFEDKAGNILVIDDGIFESREGREKTAKEGHGPWARIIARTIQEPDEIWKSRGFAPPGKKASPRLRYIARWELQGRTEPILAVFEVTASQFYIGISGFRPERLGYEEKQRNGELLYRRPLKA